jgi:hypothetical protein
MSSSPNEKIFEKLEILKECIDDNNIKNFFIIQFLLIDYFYGNFDKAYKEVQEKYPLDDIVKREIIENKVEQRNAQILMSLYGMEGNQYEEIKMSLKNKNLNASIFEIGEYDISIMFFNRVKNRQSDFFRYELALNSNNLDVKVLKRYIDSLYKTQFIDKIQSTYTLIKADKSGVSLKEINKLIITNPFTDGLKTLMLAVKDEKYCSKAIYEEAIKKLFHKILLCRSYPFIL